MNNLAENEEERRQNYLRRRRECEGQSRKNETAEQREVRLSRRREEDRAQARTCRQ